MCHGTSGGWKADSYSDVVNSGEDGPAIIPGDTQNSPLAQLIRGERGGMPPGSKLDDADLQTILAWIAAGAPDN
jgi:hypothetical protein